MDGYFTEIILICCPLAPLNLSGPMHLRKRTTILLIVFAIVLFIVGLFASLIAVADKTQEREGYSDSNYLAPSLEMSKTVQSTKPGGALNINLNATERLIVTIALNGEIEYAKNESELENTFLLRNPGAWSITFRNDNADFVNYTYTIALTTFSPVTTYPAAGLLLPTFTTAEILLILLLPINFYDNLKKMSRKTKEITVFSAIAILAVGFMPMLMLATGTSTPLFSPTSSSMEPTVSPGDLAVVTSVDPKSLGVGDIVVFDKLMDTLDQSTPSQISSPTMHRIARIVIFNNHRYFVTKGDNNQYEDTWFVPEKGVVGKVAFTIPYVGNVVLALSRIDVKIGIIGVTLAIIALWPSKKKKTQSKVKTHEEENVKNN